MKRLLLLLPLAALITLAAFLLANPPAETGVAGVVVNAPEPPQTGFARVEAPLAFNPETHLGPHPDYQTEWWYYTGNLQTPEGDHFGFQLTFFRRALLPPAQRSPDRESDWAFDQVYLAHFALSDVRRGDFYAFERFGRGAAGVAGAQANPYQVWLESWNVTQTGENTYLLEAQQGDVQLELSLVDTKGPVLQGSQGYSQKGPDPGNASFYVSQTRLAASGTVTLGGDRYPVSGFSWMDHEYSTSALSEGQVGWDWFSIQLDNNTELMLFYLNREDGSVDPFSSGTLIFPDGRTQALTRADFTITPTGTWRSPHSDAVYPSGWRVNVPGHDISLEIQPHQKDQELNLTYTYWEGAVRVSGQFGTTPVAGHGYVELTGYSGTMAGEF